MARAPIGGLMDTNVPSQLDEADLSAELELEIPDSQETPLMLDSGEEIEIVEEDDGGVLVTGPVLVLCVLGIHPGPNVFLDWRLGWPAPSIRCCKVLSLHNGWLYLNAVGYLMVGD